MLKQKKLVQTVYLIGLGLSPTLVLAQGGVGDAISKVEVDAYGQVNQALMVSDTSEGTEQYIVDNDNSSSRAGVHINAPLSNTDLSVGAHVELEYQQNPSNVVNEAQKSISGEFKERHLNVFLKGGFGKVSLGQGDGAANGNTERDLSGTKVVTFTNLALVGGGLNFVDESQGTSVRLGAAVSNQDFESRYDRLRYDLPSFGPVALSVSQGIKGNDDVSEVGARFSAELGGKLDGAIGYSVKNASGSNGDASTVGGSLSWLHSSGFNLTGAVSRVSYDDSAKPDSDFFLVKAGYKFGKHAFEVHLAEAKDRVSEGDTVESIGAGYVYTPVKWLNTYVGYNNHSLDRSGSDFEDISTLIAGARLKF